MKISKNNIGLILFVLYILQYWAQVEIPILTNVQQDSTYRHWSGLGLFSLILYQWLLPIYKVVYEMKGEALEKQIAIHNWLGMISPLVFFLHSAKPTYGMLFILSVLFFLNLLFGFLNIRNASKHHFLYFRLGIAVHIACSVAILLLSGLHIWLVFYYN